MTSTVTVAQRRARLAARHHLATPAESVTATAEAMVALHATDPLTVYLSAWARTGCATKDVESALYEARGLVRMLGMRRTMFVLPAALAPIVQGACTDDVARRLRRQLERDLERMGGIAGAEAWLRDVENGVSAALAARGSASGAELSADEPRLRTQLIYAQGKSYGGPVNITSRVLMLMSADGLIIRGRPRGGWSSGQFTWHPKPTWLGDPAGSGLSAGAAGRELSAGGGAEVLVDVAGGVSRESAGSTLDAATARAELARRWLLTFGPAPVSDLQWWAGWTGAQTKAALARLRVIDVNLDCGPGVMLADDDDLGGEPVPAAALLPALDPTPMGWQDRSWFLGPHGPSLFDRTGNIGPTVWWEGRIIGGWAQRASGEIVWRLLEDAGSEAATAVAAQAARLTSWLDSGRVTPRFRTPLERELST
jgi:hypothetical protein